MVTKFADSGFANDSREVSMKRSKAKAQQVIDIRPFVAAIFFALLLACTQAFGAAPDVNIDDKGLALRGYDPVAYFETGNAELGDASHSATIDGTTYHFTSAERREKFLEAPQTYVPNYGGYCAYGVAVGQKFDGDPEVFAVVDGKLYLQLDRATQTLWMSEVEKNIAIADRTWPVIQQIPAAVLND
ncbi:hypothetical protein NUH88_03690 [Nisaea acidiphila]|uniref:YHS domain-containing protein n=1 Tax=Nisaea acidiphila TaxID=1862145 RepID=A0A9J7ATX2_9PROT|nr:YHS domain-containing (seleno)protein [Nisaea acidiphila]UUX50808.1 hypothetical protein NUH88_03690 [Nisaea acidiphila]